MAFDVKVTDITGSGLSRTVTAQVTNGGLNDAHGVCGKIEVFSQGSKINIGGAEHVRVDLGTLRAGERATKQATVQFGFFDGLKLSQNGATVVLTVISDEATQTFNFDIRV